jgi:uncharacterized lipoprotein YajG
MKVTFKHHSVFGELELSDTLADFFVWLSINRQDDRAASLLTLLAEHDRENDTEEKQNIRRTLDEVLANNHNEKPTDTAEAV